MIELTPQKLKEIYKKLPEDLKEAMSSVDSSEIIQNIGRKHQLTVDKMGELAGEIGLVMLGLTHPRDFISNLSQRLGVDKEKAGKIAEDANGQIFAKVRESLKKIHGIEPLPPRKEPVPPVPVPVLKPETELAAPKPEIQPAPHPFEAKTKEEIFRAPAEEKKYSNNDPYREPIN